MIHPDLGTPLSADLPTPWMGLFKPKGGQKKKRRKINSPKGGCSQPQNLEVVKKDYLQALPFETLAEILAYSSILSILSIARCSRWLCHTLTQHDAAIIWKEARARCAVEPIPDPPPNLSEHAYASALFDGGECLICKTEVKGPPKYFPIKLFLCSSPGCRNGVSQHFYQREWDASSVSYHSSAYTQVDRLLAPALVMYHVRVSNYDTDALCVYKPDREQGIQEWDMAGDDEPAKATLIDAWTNKAIRRTVHLQKHSDRYDSWYQLWSDRAASSERSTKRFWHKKVADNKWPKQAFINSPTLQRLLRVCAREDETLDEERWLKHSGAIIDEMQMLLKIDANRKMEHARSARQEATEHIWRLNKSNPDVKDLMPGVKTFRNLPVVHSLEKDDAILDLKQTLQSREVQKVIKSGLQTWNDTNRKVLLAKLGFKKVWKPDVVEQWKGDAGDSSSANPRIHPLERATALFECQRCHRNGRIFAPNTSLTFSEVIKHRCPKNTLGPSGKEKREWDIKNFGPDTTAIKAIKLALQVADEDEERITPQIMSKKFVQRKTYRWQCMTCSSRITLPFEMIAGHAKRHKAQRERDLSSAKDCAIKAPKIPEPLQTAPKPERAALAPAGATTAPLTFSLRFVPEDEPATTEQHASTPDIEWLMGVTKAAIKAREKKNLGCRHCLFSMWTGTAGVRLVRNNAKGLEEKAMTVDGLRSHLVSNLANTRHGIAPIRSEDFYYLEPARPETKDNAMADAERFLNELTVPELRKLL
ncbi:hypothetical protein FRB97_001748 [Tulasnella sp. 331]|nr:hypothetical protein FRB97_001748 [Tulasnella sp. 331]